MWSVLVKNSHYLYPLLILAVAIPVAAAVAAGIQLFESRLTRYSLALLASTVFVFMIARSYFMPLSGKLLTTYQFAWIVSFWYLFVCLSILVYFASRLKPRLVPADDRRDFGDARRQQYYLALRNNSLMFGMFLPFVATVMFSFVMLLITLTDISAGSKLVAMISKGYFNQAFVIVMVAIAFVHGLMASMRCPGKPVRFSVALVIVPVCIVVLSVDMALAVNALKGVKFTKQEPAFMTVLEIMGKYLLGMLTVLPTVFKTLQHFFLITGFVFAGHFLGGLVAGTLFQGFGIVARDD